MASAQDACRLALQFGLDVSGSVSAAEYDLQLQGLAAALEDAEVRAALLAMPQVPVALSAYEWSGRDAQRLLADWQLIRDEADLSMFANQVRGATRAVMGVSTGLGTALLYGQARFANAPGCLRRVIDISGDGKSNDGPRPQDVPADTLDGTLVNALVIGPDQANAIGAQATAITELIAYFQAYVIRGPEAFVEVAVGYDDYAAAMKRKLLKELDVIVLGQARPPMRPSTPGKASDRHPPRHERFVAGPVPVSSP
ncbi:uncharacterized protein DUF1194 [Aliiruegeria haliotis]|uniref:Uncharacterized protein DUF1194 n=1 Tax=Aliiruegeria haliotis TaxID=1280846 RepID=A0A2T0RVY7_9RHOB|nr:uncharacterized protein DUF1194 [Aliiruegeria haliotis]